MPLQKQIITQLFSDGVDTKSNDLVSQGNLVLQDATLNKMREIQPRNGYKALGLTVLGTARSLTVPNFTARFNEELLTFENTKLYSYSEVNDAWVDKGNVSSLKITKQDIIKNTYQQSLQDANTNGNITVYAWADTRGGIRYAVVDELKQAVLVSDTQLSGTGVNPKVISCGYYIFIYYVETTNLKQARIDIGNPLTAPTVATLATDVSATLKFHDETKISTAMLGIYVNTGGTLRLYYATQNQQVGNGVNGFPTPISTDQTPSHAANIYNLRDFMIFIASFSSTTGTSVTRYNPDFSVATASNLVDASTTVTNAITMSEASPTSVNIYYTVTAGNAINTYIQTSVVPTVGLPGAFPVLARSVGLAGKAFTIEGVVYVPCVFQTPLQPTYFLIRNDRFIVGRFTGLNAGSLPVGMLPEFASLTTTTGFMALLQKGPLLTEVGKAFTQTGVIKVSFDFNASTQFSSFQVGRNLHIAGGYLQNYDGNSATEHGFHVFPEGTTAVVSATAGVLNGTYSYVAVYEWTDAQGQIHRSAPSAPVQLSPAMFKVDLTIPTLRLTAKKDNRTNVVIGIYRTKTLGSVYYRITSITSPLYNDPTVDTVTYTDNATDASIAGNELLYTTGGVVDNIAPPACQYVKNFANRIILGGLEEPNQIWYSKFFTVGQGIGFSDQFIMQIDTEGGNVTSLGVLDDKIIFFKEAQLYYVSGDGPTDTGAQNTFTLPVRIATDSGSFEFNSIVVGPDGLYYKSQKGIYRLSRQLEVSYVGAPVEDFNNLTVTSGILIESANEVRFLTSDGDALIYNYFFGQWSTFRNHKGKSAVIWNRLYTYITTTNNIFVETPGVYSDNGQSIKMKIVTQWFSFAQVQGFMRVYKFNVLGKYKGKHKLVVRIGYDFEQFFMQQVNFNSDLIFDTTTYGEDSPYGDGVFAGQPSVYQYRVNTTKQKVESIRVSIEDVFQGNANEGYTLTGLEFEVGQKQGGMKIPASRSGG